MKDVLRARRRPQRKKPMVIIGERPPSPNRDEPQVSLLRQDHGLSVASPTETAALKGQLQLSTGDLAVIASQMSDLNNHSSGSNVLVGAGGHASRELSLKAL
jgi:hypothetical protein